MGIEVMSATWKEVVKGKKTRSSEREGMMSWWRMVAPRRRATSERKTAAAKTNLVMDRRWRRAVDLGLAGLGRRKAKARVASECQ
jgi:hypothetical protein